MTVNILFLTIMFKKREISIEEAIHQEVVEKMYENTKVQRISMYDYI
ncbi:YrzI family small protein [Neobacillus niacini]